MNDLDISTCDINEDEMTPEQKMYYNNFIKHLLEAIEHVHTKT
ncbi:MAG: hypothetical protein N2645_07890 [Clostridia bacterium]|nr:hypothetical protein [Clostridia bacterium]